MHLSVGGLQRVWLPAAILFHAALAIGYLAAIPAFNWPDEPAHLSYILNIADGHGLPVMTRESWAPEQLERLKREHFHGVTIRDPRITGISYEAHQPPLYYLLAALLFRLTRCVTAVRLFNLLLSCAVVAITPCIVRSVFPRERWIAPSAAFLLALHPMRCAMAVSLGNDPASEVMWAAVLLAISRAARPRSIGLLIGAGALVKLTAVLAIPVYVAWLWIVGGRSRRLRSSVQATWPALALVTPWLARNVVLYGWADPLALAAGALGFEHSRPRLELVGDYGVSQLLWRTFQSWWGTFGWMEMLPDPRALALYVVVSAVALTGLVVLLMRERNRTGGSKGRGRLVVWMIVAHLVLLAALMIYSLHDFQAQGRYLLVLSPFSAMLIAVGLRELTGRLLPACAVATGIAFLGVDLFNICSVIPWYLAR